MKLEEDKIKYVDESLVDDVGRVFWMDGQIYRGIYKNKIEQVTKLMKCGLIEELINDRIIPSTTVSSYYSEQYPMILNHETVNTQTYPYERITYNMIRDEGLLVLRLADKCFKYGYILKDVHRYNILYKDGSPIWIDIGSIVPCKEFILDYGTFLSSYIMPLLMLNANSVVATYILRNDKNLNLRINEYICLYQGVGCSLSSVPYLRWHYMPPQAEKNENSIINELREGLIEKKISKTTWGEYQDELSHEKIAEGREVFKGDFERYKDILSLVLEIGPTSILEFGSNAGALSIYLMCECEKKGCRISNYYASDYDVNAIDRLYIFLKDNIKKYKYLRNIKPLVIDFTDVNRMYWEKGFEDRFKSDLVLAMAISHHLLLAQGMSMRSLFYRMSKCTNRYLLIEFMPYGLWAGGDIYPNLPEWYNEENFKENMQEYFSIKYEKRIGANRIVFIGELKDFSTR